MKFGPVALSDAHGAVLAHSVSAGGRNYRKGTVLCDAELAALRSAGVNEVVAARLSVDDISEDEAAARLARRVAGAGVIAEEAFTGRVNLYAESAGVLIVDSAGVDTLNAIDESVTFATLPAFAMVEAGRMVGTVKIIPFAVPGTLIAAAEAAALEPLLRIAPFSLTRAGLIQTFVAGTQDKVLDKTRRVTEARLAAMGAHIIAERRVPHRASDLAPEIAALRAEGAELILVFGASAIADRRDVIPAAIAEAGGAIRHFGMPVDPGNLLLIGEIGGIPVLGAPGCARSPKENGFDWVLSRLMARLPVSRADIVRLGVGGLLMEIATRPQPREERPSPAETPRIGGVLLAAGRSTRMGGPNKLLAAFGDKTVVRHAAEALVNAGVSPVVVVTGHMAGEVEAVLSGLPVRFIHNTDFAQGLSTSLRCGIAALPGDVDGAVVALGDMPLVGGGLIRALVAAFDPAKGKLIAQPSVNGQRGNPVLWARRFFPALQSIEGDTGARHVLAANDEAVAEVLAESEGALIDVDTREALEAARRLASV